MNRGVVIGAAVGILALGAVALFVWRGDTRSSPTDAVSAQPSTTVMDTAALAPDGVRVRVQVLNGSGRNGLARRATQRLRDHGYDVVDYGSRGDTMRVTAVQVTAATRAWGDRIAKALGGGTVRVLDGSLGYVDVVVLLGRDWQPTAQPLRP
jgi:hypothetical protein